MRRYQIRFLDNVNDVFGTHEFDAKHDEAAITHAHSIYPSKIGEGYEIWQGERHVHSVTYG